jgi:hypothetical protein
MSMSNAFLSYTRRDGAFVDMFGADLQKAGVRIWRDTEQIQPGQQWQRANEDALGNVCRYPTNQAALGGVGVSISHEGKTATI